MRIYTDVFNDFRCIGGECKRNCCCNWNITLDKATAEYYRSLEDDFGKKLASLIKEEEDGSLCFVLQHGEPCVAQDENKLCLIYQRYGEEHMSDICKSFPRIDLMSGFEGDYSYSLVLNQCEAVLYMLYDRPDPLRVMIEYEGELQGMDALVYDLAQLSAWTAAIIQDESISLPSAVATVLHVGNSVVKLVREGDLEGIENEILSSSAVTKEYERVSKSIPAEDMEKASWEMISGIMDVFFDVMDGSEDKSYGDFVAEKEKSKSCLQTVETWREHMTSYKEELLSKEITFLRRFIASILSEYAMGVAQKSSEKMLIEIAAPRIILSLLIPSFWGECIRDRREYLSRLSMLQRALGEDFWKSFGPTLKREMDLDETSYAIMLCCTF